MITCVANIGLVNSIQADGSKTKNYTAAETTFYENEDIISPTTMIDENEEEMAAAADFDEGSVEWTAIELTKDIILRRDQVPAVISRHTMTMRRTVDLVLDRHGTALSSMVDHLTLSNHHAAAVTSIVVKSFQTVVDEILADGQFNWGRLVTVYAFAAVLVRHCRQAGLLMGSDDDDLLASIGLHVARRMGLWVGNNGGWDEFERFFAVRPTPERALWRSLLVTTVVGLGAVAALVATR